jgi:anti-sigma factor RsiW
MSAQTDERRLLLETWSDGELHGEDAVQVERWIAEDPACAEYAAALRDLREMVRTPICLASEEVDFSSLHARIDAALDAAPSTGAATRRRDAELERLAMAHADGELHGSDRDRVVAYLQDSPEAQDAWEGVGELGDSVRATIEQAMQSARFDGFAARLDARIDALEGSAPVSSPAPVERVGFFTQLAAFFGAHRALVASALTAAVTAGLVFTFMDPAGRATASMGTELAQQPTVINNYYIAAPVVDSMEYENGFWGSVSPGDRDQGIAPVIWIEAEPADDAPSPSDLPL